MVNAFHVLASPGATAVRLLPLLADAAIKGIVVFGMAACAVALCRRRSAATRHAIWAGAVAAQLTLPILCAFLPAWRVPLIERLDQRLESPAPMVMSMAPYAVTVVAPPSAPIMIGRGVGRGVGVGRVHGPRHSSFVYVAPHAIRIADAGDAFSITGGDLAVRQSPRFNLIGVLRSLRNHTPAWW